MNLLNIATLLLLPALTTSGRPNIIIMLMDDMGWGDVGANGFYFTFLFHLLIAFFGTLDKFVHQRT